MSSLSAVVGRSGFALVLLGMSACSSAPAVREFPSTASPSEEIKRLEDDLARAESQQLDVFAPEAFKKSRAQIEEAREEKDSNKALHEVAVGRFHYDQVNDKGQRNKGSIEEVALARKQAIDANARVLFTSDFKRADDDLKDVTADLEEGQDSSAKKSRSDLQKTYLDLELRSIKRANLGQAKETIDLAKKEGAKQHAPMTLARVEKNAEDVEAYITGNRHSAGEITAKANEVRANADHLLKITREAKQTRKASPEEVALRLEAERNQVKAKEGVISAKQSEINAKQNEIQSKEALLGDTREEIARKQAQLGAIAGERDELEAEKAFEAKFEEARAQFSESEAEVYKQGNSLTIRLKSLQFPKAKATLKGDDFALLAKVKDVISGFGQSSVVVEGHTDSDGSEKTNLKLSNDRANAVTDYLVSSEAVDRSQITAVGYGYQKPLASNKTPADKAKNRRVDVIISPERAN